MPNPFKIAEGVKVQLTKQQNRDIRKVYKDAYKEVKRELESLSYKQTDYAIQRTQQLKQLQKELSDTIQRVDSRTETIINKNMDTMVQAVLTDNKNYLTGLGYNGIINNLAIKSDVINRITTGQIYGGKWNLSSAIWGDDSKKISEIEKIIAKGVAENKTVEQIAQQLTRYVNPDKRIPYNIVGVRNVIDYNALRLARTAIQHAYEEAFVSATRLNPFIDAYRWVTSGSHNVCGLCIERATIDQYGLGGGIFPKDSLPLDHPNGQCTFEPVTTMSEAEIGEAIADWYLGEGDPQMNEALNNFADYLQNA